MPNNLPNSNPLSYLGVRAEDPPTVLQIEGAPTTSDTRGANGPFELGTIWVDTLTGVLYGLGMVDGTTATWAVLGDAQGGFPITPFVVGLFREGGYQTIQDALDAANSAGGGVVYIQPGSYTENLTLFDNVDLYGTPAVSQNEGASVTITGVHTPPTSGHVGFNSICFISTTDAFFSTAAGSTHLVFLNCESGVQNGYFLNLLNWTGILELTDNNPDTAGAPAPVDDGGINNTGGSDVLIFNAGIGFNGTNPMTISGLAFIESAEFGAPVNFVTGAQLAIQWATFDDIATFAENSTGFIYFSSFLTGADEAISMKSTAAIDVEQCVVDSTNVPAIDGTGVGILTLGNITFPNNSAVAATLTLAHAASRQGATSLNGNLSLPLPATQLQIEGGAVTDFIGTTTMIAGVATIANTNIAATDRIFIQRIALNASPAAGTFIYSIIAATSFTITSIDIAGTTIVGDVSTITYQIIREL